MQKMLYLIAICILMSCALTHDDLILTRNCDVIKVAKKDAFWINQWKNNKVRIMHIDTVRPWFGEEYYKVKFK
jgi:hypothetical protein